MGSRRLGRKRLYSLEKEGQALTTTDIATGAGMLPAVTRVRQSRDGVLITTEICLDLQAVESHGNNNVIGLDAGGAGEIFKWDASVFGQLLDIDLYCTEDLAGGSVDLTLSSNNATVAAKAAGNGNTDHITLTNIDKGDSGSSAAIAAIAANNVFFYLHADAATDAAYTAGKLVIRVTGFDDTAVPDA